MKDTVCRAIDGFKNREGWQILQKRAMLCDNSWKTSANAYIGLYKEICTK
ncbi:MAG: hypothetical protein II342_03645 [Clostridia bacterium]|nr:hypothetical protein [Clostridia bacterium]